ARSRPPTQSAVLSPGRNTSAWSRASKASTSASILLREKPNRDIVTHSHTPVPRAVVPPFLVVFRRIQREVGRRRAFLALSATTGELVWKATRTRLNCDGRVASIAVRGRKAGHRLGQRTAYPSVHEPSHCTVRDSGPRAGLRALYV